MTLNYLTSENYTRLVEKSTTPVIVDFYADWCMPCKMMGPIFEDLSKDYAGKLTFLKLDTEKETALAEKFEVQGIPMLLVLKKGQEIGRLIGFAPKPVLKQRIDGVLSQKQ